MKKLFTLAVAVALCSTMGFAQGLALKGVGGNVGYITVSPTGSESSLGGFVIGAHADLGEISPSFQLVPELQYWSVSKDVSVEGITATDKWSAFTINGNVRYNIAMEGAIKPYAGAGLGLNFWSNTADVPAQHYGGFTIGGGTATQSGTRLGINLMAGANYAMGNMTITPELRYVLASDINHLIIKVGVMVPLGK